MTHDETAAFLRIHPTTLKKLRLRKDFPKPIKVGEGSVRFDRAEIEAWFRDQPRVEHGGGESSEEEVKA